MRDANYTKNNTPKRKKEIRTYSKMVQDFSSGIDELREISTVAADILGYEQNLTPEMASMNMFNAIADNFPSVNNRDTTFWSINVASTRCILKTGLKVSFGWKLKYEFNKEDRTNTLKDIEFIITDFDERDDIAEMAEQFGWYLNQN